MSASRSQPVASEDDTLTDAPSAALPFYVAEALQSLTRAQKQYVMDGCIHGDVTMATVRALRNKALFYLHPTSPNGRCGDMRLTPLGVTVRGILRQRAALRKAEGAS